MDVGTASQQIRLIVIDENARGDIAFEESCSPIEDAATAADRGSSSSSSSSLSVKIPKDNSEVPEDIRAFYGHPLTAASHSVNGDGLALLHEYQSLPSINRLTLTSTDPTFASTNTLSSSGNSLEFDDVMELSHQPLPTSLQTSSITYTSSGDFIRHASLFHDEVEAGRGETEEAADRDGSYLDGSLIQRSENSFHQLNGSQPANLTREDFREGGGGSVYPDQEGDLAVEGRGGIFAPYEDDPGLEYYEPGGCGDDIQGHEFQMAPTVMQYDLVIPQVNECLGKIIPEQDAGILTRDANVFCVASSDGMIGVCSRESETMQLSQGCGHSEADRNPQLFCYSTDAAAKTRPRSKRGGKNPASSIEDIGGVLSRSTGKKRASGTCAARRRKATIGTAGDSLTSLVNCYANGCVASGQMTKTPLVSYDATLGSGSVLVQRFNGASSNSVFIGQDENEAYQSSTLNEEDLVYLDEDYRQLISTNGGLSLVAIGNQKAGHEEVVEMEYCRDQSSDVWQSQFLPEDFHIAASSAGCFQQPQDPGGVQWCVSSAAQDLQRITFTTAPPPALSKVSEIVNQTRGFGAPWLVPASGVTASPNTPINMTAYINEPPSNGFQRTLQSSTFPLSLPASGSLRGSGDTQVIGDTQMIPGATYHTLSKTVRRSRRKQPRVPLAGSMALINPSPIVPHNPTMEGPNFTPNRRLPSAHGCYTSAVHTIQRQMPGMLSTEGLAYSVLEKGGLQRSDHLGLEQTNKENDVTSCGQLTTAAPVHPHLTERHVPALPVPSNFTNGSGAHVKAVNLHQVATANHDRDSLPGIVHGTPQSSNTSSSTMTTLPFPIPAVPPGYRLVITHHPLPTENEHEPQQITQLIIDNPSTAYHANQTQDNLPCPQPYPRTNLSQEEVVAATIPALPIAPKEVVHRATRPTTLEFLPQLSNHVTSPAVNSTSSSNSNSLRNDANTCLVFPVLKTEPASPLEGGTNLHHINPVVINPPQTGASSGVQPPVLPVTEDLLEMSMRQAKVLHLVSNRRPSVERQGYAISSNRGSVDGRLGRSVDTTPMSSDSGSGTPLREVFPGSDGSLLPLNLTGTKSVLLPAGGVQSFPYEVNNNDLQTDSIHSSAGPTSPPWSHSDDWPRILYSLPSSQDIDSSGTFQDGNAAVVRENFPVTPDGVPGIQRQVSVSGVGRKVQRSRTPSVRRSKQLAVDKIDPDLSGYEFYLDAPISTNAHFDEDRVTYLNKGQYYSLFLKYDPTDETDFIFRNMPVKSVVMVMFRERQPLEEEIRAWEFWHSRQHSLKQRVLDIDGKNFGTEGVPMSVEEVAYNAVNVIWKRQEKPIKVNIALNCLSTDFSHQKGVKGNPLHIQIDTFAGDEDTQALVHRAYCQIKVFCDKGADRKSREEERKRTKSIESELVEEKHHDPCDRSYFYRMADVTTPPVLFTPANSLTTKPFIKEPMYAIEPSAIERGLSSVEEDSGQVIPSKRSRSYSYDQQRTPQRILLYAREEADNVFNALMLENPTLSALSNAIHEKFNVPANAIRNIYNRSRKSVTIKVDDNVVRHFANESTFIIYIEQLQQQPVVNDNGEDPPTAYYDVTLAEIQL